jgi:hypothetical protein
MTALAASTAKPPLSSQSVLGVSPINNPIFHSISLGMLLILATFAFWQTRWPDTLTRLFECGDGSSWNDSHAAAKDRQQFDTTYEQHLRSPLRFLVVATTTLIAFASLMYVPRPEWQIVQLSTTLTWRALPQFVLVGLLTAWAVVFGILSWILIVTGWSLRAMTRRYKLRIIVGHPDGCGGLEDVGNTCALMALVPAVGLLPYSVALAVSLKEGLTTPGNVILFAGAGVLVWLAFLLPVWNVHCQLTSRRQQLDQDYGLWIEHLHKRWSLATLDSDEDEVKRIKDATDVLDRLKPSVLLGRWPFAGWTFASVALPQIVSVVSLLTNLVRHPIPSQ